MDRAYGVLNAADTIAAPDDALLRLLTDWLPRQRWFPAKDRAFALRPRHSYTLGPAREAAAEATREAATAPATDGHGLARPRVAAHLLHVGGEGIDAVVHVPLVLRPGRPHTGGPGRAAPDPTPSSPPDASTSGPDNAGPLIGMVRDGTGRAWTVHDGAADPAYWSAVLQAAEWEAETTAAGGSRPVGPLDRAAARPRIDLTGARPLGVEQSNSSVLLPRIAGGMVLKVLRTITPGPHPDVTIPRALAALDWPGTPAPLAWLGAAWGAGADENAHLAVGTRLVPDARDGFALACDLARAGRSFATEAASLGRTVAGLHAALRTAFGTAPAPDTRAVIAELRKRTDAAAHGVAAIGARRAALERFWDRLAAQLTDAGPLPAAQAIHGDLHLGQVLRAADGAWLVLDFEGEPNRPADERTRPDLPLRDVAGVLRSIDYAAAVGGAADPGWAAEAGRAFTAAYLDAAGPNQTGPDPTGPNQTEALLTGFTLDKAIYEAEYESRSRPDWLRIPLAAVDALLAADARG